MRKLLLAAPLVAAFVLSGCTTTQQADAKAFVEQVRQSAVAVCGFLPTVDTVVAIVASGNPIAATVSGIANAICAAVSSLPPLTARKKGAAPPTVAGVVIHGRFVGRK